MFIIVALSAALFASLVPVRNWLRGEPARRAGLTRRFLGRGA